MKQIYAIALTCLTALPALAAEPMSATDFESYVTGKTLYFGLNGEAYGVEKYLPDRKVLSRKRAGALHSWISTPLPGPPRPSNWKHPRWTPTPTVVPAAPVGRPEGAHQPPLRLQARRTTGSTAGG